MAEKKNLNTKITELDEKIEWFYSDEFELSEAIKRFEEVTKLAKEIDADLDKLKNEVKVLAKDFSK